MAKMPDMTVKVNVLEVSALQELAQEFRRRAGSANSLGDDSEGGNLPYAVDCWTRAQVWDQAAQMLEDKIS